MRDNTERLRPPRFLWVPFELGRPFGAPNEPEFQTRILRAVLDLFARAGPPPVLDDFPDDAPGTMSAEEMAGWTCPIPLPRVEDTSTPELLAAVLAEIEGLGPWHRMALETRGRTATGVLGVGIDTVARFLHGFLDGPPENPKPGIPLGEAFRQAGEEIKNFYMEAATAKPGKATSRELADWFWGETAAGRLMLVLQPVAVASADEGVRWVGTSQLVPRAQRHRLR